MNELFLIFFVILYVIIIAVMCWSEAEQMRKPSNKKIEDFVKKNIKRYK